MEGLIHGGKFACQNRLGQPYSWKEILHLRAISKPPGGSIFGGAIWQRCFCVTRLGGLYLEWLYMVGLIFGILRYVLYCGLHFAVRTHKFRCQQNLTQLRPAVAHSE